MKPQHLLYAACWGWLARACEVCEGEDDVVLTRFARRMQPDAIGTSNQPYGPLFWGQLNFLHTTDTHGWLGNHLLEGNYGADWGDFVSFTKHMRQKAQAYGVDLLLVDTGDLHDGTGLSDATDPNGAVSNPIFEKIDYDILSIGNHELYETDIAYETATQFAKHYGDKYLTSNVQIMDPNTKQFNYIGKQFRYFTTNHGIRVMAFGVLYDFTGNSNVSKVIKAADMIKQPWFKQAVNYNKPVDLFLLIGHNPVRPSVSGSTIGTVYNAIRQARPKIPIQVFGGHTHIRDFVVYDQMATGLESGRYCETLGWVAMNGFTTGTAKLKPGVPVANRAAISVRANPRPKSNSTFRYARRYLDWNRATFEYHANGSQTGNFDTKAGQDVTNEVYQDRKNLNLTQLYGCTPQTWCQNCKPFGDEGNIFTILSKALATTVINKSRPKRARMIILNTGSVRFDLLKGPFTYDDSFIVSPFDDQFVYIPQVPFKNAAQVIKIMNAGGASKKRDLVTEDFSFQPINFLGYEDCPNAPENHFHAPENQDLRRSRRRIVRRQSTKLVPGYTTKDDFGNNGDDTTHQSIPFIEQPEYFQANGTFPADGSDPAKVDLIFLDFITQFALPALQKTGANYTDADVKQYLPPSFTTNSYLPAYAKVAPDWQANVPNCPVGTGVGG